MDRSARKIDVAQGPPDAQRPSSGIAAEPARPPWLLGPLAGLAGGFLFGHYVRQIVADLDAVAKGRRPSTPRIGLGEDAVEALARLGSSPEACNAVEPSYLAKLARFGEADLERL